MIGLVVGIGLWVHQLFIVYLIPLGDTARMAKRTLQLTKLGTLNRFALGLGAIAAFYLVLGIIAFMSGGFAVQIGSVAISATAPQKMARIAVGYLRSRQSFSWPARRRRRRRVMLCGVTGRWLRER